MTKEKCGARTKAGTPCERAAMENGKCHKHGGKTPKGIASPHFVHGRYSAYMPTRLNEKVQAALNDPKLLELAEDIAVIQSRVCELFEQLERGGASTAWQRLKDLWLKFQAFGESENSDAALKLLPEIGAVIKQGVASHHIWRELSEQVERRARLAREENRRRREEQFYVTVEEALGVVAAVMASVKKHVKDRPALIAIEADIRQVVNNTGPNENGASKPDAVEARTVTE